MADDDAELTPMEKLSEPIPDAFILTRPPRDEPYITAPTAEWWLDSAVGKDGWGCSYKVVETFDSVISVECTITIGDVSKSDVGTSTGGGETDDANMKQAYSDAFKRAARRWGVARHLTFDKSS